MSSNKISINNNIGNGKIKVAGRQGRPGRPAKKLLTSCSWCEESELPLKYVLSENENKKFCSKSCIAQFSNANRKGMLCLQCDNVIVASSPSNKYCSIICMNNTMTTATTPSSPSSNNVLIPNSGQINNNNNVNINDNSQNTVIKNSSLGFRWDDYLKVRFQSSLIEKFKFMPLM